MGSLRFRRVTGSKAGQVEDLPDRPLLKLGREPHLDVLLTADPAAERMVSREHAHLQFEFGHGRIYDNHDNVLLVNGHPGSNGSARLHQGDKIQFREEGPVVLALLSEVPDVLPDTMITFHAKALRGEAPEAAVRMAEGVKRDADLAREREFMERRIATATERTEKNLVGALGEARTEFRRFEEEEKRARAALDPERSFLGILRENEEALVLSYLGADPVTLPFPPARLALPACRRRAPLNPFRSMKNVRVAA